MGKYGPRPATLRAAVTARLRVWEAMVTYSGPVPGLVAGVQKLEIQIPPAANTGSDILTITIGGRSLFVPVVVN